MSDQEQIRVEALRQAIEEGLGSDLVEPTWKTFEEFMAFLHDPKNF
jgi:hypothetical protein